MKEILLVLVKSFSQEIDVLLGKANLNEKQINEIVKGVRLCGVEDNGQ